MMNNRMPPERLSVGCVRPTEFHHRVTDEQEHQQDRQRNGQFARHDSRSGARIEAGKHGVENRDVAERINDEEQRHGHGEDVGIVHVAGSIQPVWALGLRQKEAIATILRMAGATGRDEDVIDIDWLCSGEYGTGLLLSVWSLATKVTLAAAEFVFWVLGTRRFQSDLMRFNTSTNAGVSLIAPYAVR